MKVAVVTSFGRDLRALRALFVPPSRTPPLSTPVDPDPARWTREFMRRMRHHFVLKTLGITGFMWIFFVAYFHLLRHPAQQVLVMPLTAVDRWVGLEPAALAAYVSLWVYVGIPAGLMRSLHHLVV